MVSSAPADSPTPIICTTIAGKTLVSASGSAMVLPSEMAWRVLRIASSMILLPAVRATISSPSRIGTPLEISVPSVRVNFATATLRTMIPTTGSLSAMASSWRSPLLEAR